MIMIWIWQEEGLKTYLFPNMFPDDSFFLLVLSHFKFVLRLCTHPGAFTLPVHAPNYWYSNVDRLIIQDILRTSLTYHWKKLDLPTVFTCWKVLHTSLFQSRPSPLGNTPSIWLQVCSIQWGIWPKMTPAQLAIWFCVKTCQRCRQKDFLKFFPHSVCVPCSWAIALIFAVLLEHLTAFEKAQAFWNEQFYWNEQTSVRQLSKTLDISVVFSRTLTLK